MSAGRSPSCPGEGRVGAAATEVVELGLAKINKISEVEPLGVAGGFPEANHRGLSYGPFVLELDDPSAAEFQGYVN